MIFLWLVKPQSLWTYIRGEGDLRKLTSCLLRDDESQLISATQSAAVMLTTDWSPLIYSCKTLNNSCTLEPLTVESQHNTTLLACLDMNQSAICKSSKILSILLINWFVGKRGLGGEKSISQQYEEPGRGVVYYHFEYVYLQMCGHVTYIHELWVISVQLCHARGKRRIWAAMTAYHCASSWFIRSNVESRSCVPVHSPQTASYKVS